MMDKLHALDTRACVHVSFNLSNWFYRCEYRRLQCKIIAKLCCNANYFWILNWSVYHFNMNAIFDPQPFNMSEGHESQNYIPHCWQAVHIKTIICNFKGWFLGHMDMVHPWAVDIHLVFIQSFQWTTFIIHNPCHSHRFYIQPIIHMHNITVTICYRFQLAMNFTKISIRYARAQFYMISIEFQKKIYNFSGTFII